MCAWSWKSAFQILPVRVLSETAAWTQPPLPDRPEPAALARGPQSPRRWVPGAGKTPQPSRVRASGFRPETRILRSEGPFAASTSNFSTEKKMFTATASPGAVPFPLPSPAGAGGAGGTQLRPTSASPARRSQPPRLALSDGAPAPPSLTSRFSLSSRATHPHEAILNLAASEGPAELLEPSPAASPADCPAWHHLKVSSRAGGGGPESSGRSPSPRHHQPPPTFGSVEEPSWAPASPNLRAGVWGVPNLTGTNQPLARALESWRGCQ